MKTCQNCGINNPDDAVFCSECGKPLPKKESGKMPAKTMLSTPAPKLEQPPQEQPAPQALPAAVPAAKEIPQVQDGKHTIMGMPSLATGPVKAVAPAPAEPQPAPAVKAKASRPKALDEADLAKAKRAAQEAAGKTMLGVSPLAAGSIKPEMMPTQQAPSAKSYKEEKPIFEPIIESPVMAPGPQHSAPVQPQQLSTGAPGAERRTPSHPDARPRTEAPAEGFQIQEPIRRATSTRARPPVDSEAPRPSRIGSTTMLMMRKAAAVPRWLIILILIVIVGGAGLGFLIKKFVLEPMKPRVTKIALRQNPNFQSMDIELDMVNVEKIAALKIGEQTFKVEGGRCLVNLAIGPVRLGPNAIEATLLDAKGQEKGAVIISFVLTKFWQPQTQTLEEANAVAGIYFQTMPDSVLYIDGEPSSGEGPGKFLYQKTIKELMKKAPPAQGDMWVLTFDYVLQRKGAKDEKGTVQLEIPTVKLQIDRPADGAKVVDATVECTGKTELDAEVKVNGTPVDVNNGKFATPIPLSEIKVYEIEVTAVSAKRGPRVAVVKVEKVADMTAEIEAYKKDLEKDLTWDKLSREPSTYTGKKVAFQGRIFNIRTEKGVTAFQMLVSEGCPEGARCTLVATFRGETSAGEQSMATIIGEVRGIQTLETAAGSTFEAPQIEVKYVLPLEDKKKGKKER